MAKITIGAATRKVSVNWRIDRGAHAMAERMVRAHGFNSLPALVNSILIKIGSNPDIEKAVLGGAPHTPRE